jgi:DNA polymerase-3 subunit epsilon
MDFVAIDVETANADVSTICQLGVAQYRGGILESEWKSLVDPQDYFDPVNVSIHGITELTVQGAPRFSDVAERLRSSLENTTVVCHTHFDRVAIKRAFKVACLREPRCTWLDTARVARRAWEEVAFAGYGLGNVCAMIGYEFAPHDALEDAKAAAHVLLAAMKRTGLDLEGWRARVERPIRHRPNEPVAYEANPQGPLWGEVIVFTGSLSVPRSQAKEIASRKGCLVAEGVTKQTTLLVVGDHDVAKLAGHEKSTKHRKAENLIAGGQRIRILRESDFTRLVGLLG